MNQTRRQKLREKRKAKRSRQIKKQKIREAQIEKEVQIRVKSLLSGKSIPRTLFRQTSLERRYGRSFYTSPAWIEIRYEAIKRTNGKCESCGRGKKDGIVLHVDHIKPRSEFRSLELDLNNLQVLCEECNMGKGNRDTTDWRKAEDQKIVSQAPSLSLQTEGKVPSLGTGRIEK